MRTCECVNGSFLNSYTHETLESIQKHRPVLDHQVGLKGGLFDQSHAQGFCGKTQKPGEKNTKVQK